MTLSYIFVSWPRLRYVRGDMSPSSNRHVFAVSAGHLKLYRNARNYIQPNTSLSIGVRVAECARVSFSLQRERHPLMRERAWVAQVFGSTPYLFDCTRVCSRGCSYFSFIVHEFANCALVCQLEFVLMSSLRKKKGEE